MLSCRSLVFASIRRSSSTRALVGQSVVVASQTISASRERWGTRNVISGPIRQILHYETWN
jgi:hypothetical protein